MSSADDTVKRARDTLSSIYSFYANNKDDLERVPSFISDASREVPFVLRTSNPPTAEQVKSLKGDLRDIVATKEAIDNIPAKERELMIQAANASTVRRKGNKS
ncbi:hypothetical protein S7711_10586 [Stachybotrys chartarum IBT 7711]|uniref:Uncharacterized protein n=1 Tax=Stachybotrys chartarum (strain CBS 109288 / IBT 7711) TaxID=1280523 RepID=A0A084B5E4_STACB|nr:hypothetical protein S7711_10586 [Stachybotrys chartarum IBT 7711]KFA50584.1 hypothetical protein S40293_10673 [Stachybotrys chartarum IBT 40293]